MKLLALATSIVIAVVTTGVIHAGSLARANYEISLHNAKGTWTAHTSSDVVSGRPIEHDLGSYKLSLTPHIDKSGEYTLDVAVGMPSRMPNTISVPSTETFSGTLGYPIEFEVTQGEATIKGAFIMSYVE